MVTPGTTNLLIIDIRSVQYSWFSSPRARRASTTLEMHVTNPDAVYTRYPIWMVTYHFRPHYYLGYSTWLFYTHGLVRLSNFPFLSNNYIMISYPLLPLVFPGLPGQWLSTPGFQTVRVDYLRQHAFCLSPVGIVCITRRTKHVRGFQEHSLYWQAPQMTNISMRITQERLTI